jgi:hypothetical protein
VGGAPFACVIPIRLKPDGVDESESQEFTRRVTATKLYHGLSF